MKLVSKKTLISASAGIVLVALSTSAMALYHINTTFYAQNSMNTSTGISNKYPLDIKVNSVSFTPAGNVAFDPSKSGDFVGKKLVANPKSSSSSATQTILAGTAPGSQTYSMAINFTTSINSESVTQTKTIDITGNNTVKLLGDPAIDLSGQSCNFTLSYPQPSPDTISFFVNCYPIPRT